MGSLRLEEGYLELLAAIFGDAPLSTLFAVEPVDRPRCIDCGGTLRDQRGPTLKWVCIQCRHKHIYRSRGAKRRHTAVVIAWQKRHPERSHEITRNALRAYKRRLASGRRKVNLGFHTQVLGITPQAKAVFDGTPRYEVGIGLGEHLRRQQKRAGGITIVPARLPTSK